MSENNTVAAPQEIVFGERFEDNSGYSWRVALVMSRNGDRRLEFGEDDMIFSVDVMTVQVRAIASALNQIADLLGEGQ